MKHIANYQRQGFLKDHPPVMQRVLLTSSGAECTLLAGTVIGKTKSGSTTTVAPWQVAAEGSTSEALGILAEDVLIPATGGAYALMYAHAAVIASELIWADGVSALDQQTALEALRGKGIYASEA